MKAIQKEVQEAIDMYQERILKGGYTGDPTVIKQIAINCVILHCELSLKYYTTSKGVIRGEEGMRYYKIIDHLKSLLINNQTT